MATAAKAVKLVSMKRTPEDKREDMGEPPSIEAIAPDYPWGLCINMDYDELEKLGMKDLPAVGSEFGMHVKVRVTRCQQSAVEGHDEEKSCSLQIIEAAVVPPGE